MSTNNLPVLASNQVEVENYVDRIKKHMSDATFAWRQISEILAEAANEFGCDSDKMKSLRKQTGFSKSKVSKLIAIATSKRLSENYALFQTTHAWTVLYEVTKLTDEEFETFLENVSVGDIITQSTVNKARVKTVKKPDPYKTVFNLQIDLNALKSGMFSGTDYEELYNAIEKIQNTLNYVRVVETNQFENDAARYVAEVDREFDKAVRKEFSAALNSYKSRSSDKTMFGAFTKEELNQLMRDKDYATAFDALGSDRFDQARLYEEASSNVQAKRAKKFGPLVRPHDEFANTEIQSVA